MISWKNLESDLKFHSIDKLLSEITVIDVIRICYLSFRGPVIFINKKIKQNIYDHINTMNSEMGGILLGKVYSDNVDYEKVTVVYVSDIEPSKDYDSTTVSLRINVDIWNEVRNHICEDRIVVGWYHSHPNLGAFFSGIDRNTQKNFFNQPYNLGLVIDPIQKLERWFIGEESIETFNVFDVDSMDKRW